MNNTSFIIYTSLLDKPPHSPIGFFRRGEFRLFPTCCLILPGCSLTKLQLWQLLIFPYGTQADSCWLKETSLLSRCRRRHRQVGRRAGSPFVVIITFKDLQLDGHGGNPAPLSCDLNLPPSHFPPPPPSLSASLSSAPSSSLMNTERRIKYSWRRRARAKGGGGGDWGRAHARAHARTRTCIIGPPPPPFAL